MHPEKKTKSRRIIELDLLRGYFIFVIIIDHLAFWPSPFGLFSGEGRLWTSAAEGFFIISGLLVGYIRAYRGAKTPLKTLTAKLVRRALLLYVWGVVISLFVIIFTLCVGGNERLPALPNPQYLTNAGQLVLGVISLDAFNEWIYFLRLYTVMLLATPIFLLLLRRGVPYWVVGIISVGLYALSFLREIPDAELQWQLLFFLSALVGYKMEAILDWLRDHRRAKRLITGWLIGMTAVTVCISAFLSHGYFIAQLFNFVDFYHVLQNTINPIFSNNPMSVARNLISFLWFGGFLALFHITKPWIRKWAQWLLLPFGQMSLTGYCLQAIVLSPIVVLFAPWNIVTNTLITAGTILLVWVLLKVPIIKKVLPQ